jgi:hypothetical protein
MFYLICPLREQTTPQKKCLQGAGRMKSFLIAPEMVPAADL